MYWSQLHTILWLRWRLTRNQWSRGGRLNMAISVAIVVLLLLIGGGGSLGSLLIGRFALGACRPAILLVVYDLLILLFLLFWLLGVVGTIQRSEIIDVEKLLHLPVSLRGIFLVNYVASHVTLSIIVFLPALLGLALGMALSRNGRMILLVPLILGFLFMVTAWTYCLRGWLVILMKNPRRHRAVVAGVTILFFVVIQIPGLLSIGSPGRSRSPHGQPPSQTAFIERERDGGLPPVMLLAHAVAPPLWIGYGAMSLAEGNPLPTLLAGAGMFGIGGLGLARAYRSTRRFYEGQTAGKQARRVRKDRRAVLVGTCFVEHGLPGLPEGAAAVALASLRSLTCATEVRMALVSDVLMLLILGATAWPRQGFAVSERAQFLWGTAAALLPFPQMIHLMTNQFGFDRAGFRTLVLSPVPRPQILFGKNVAMLPLVAVVGVVDLALAWIVLHLHLMVLAAAFMQVIAAFFLTCTLGNLFSSLIPIRLGQGSLAGTKVSRKTGLLSLLSHLVCASALSILLLPALAAFALASRAGPAAGGVNLLLSLVELGLITAIYRRSLPGLGRLLLRREQEILRVVTQDVE